MKVSKRVLPIIVISQFFCTSLWFAGNGIMTELMIVFELEQNALSYLTSMVQFGFITGTLAFAILSIADRYSPSKVFFTCAILGAICNLGIMWSGNTLASLLFLRFSTGFFLAGIYPVGMKIAADYFEKGLGKSLGFLVGALVLGTALPHLLSDVKGELPWESVILATSLLASLGGLLIVYLVPDGPYRKASQKLQLSAIRDVFIDKTFRSAAFGYFGHMWELYAFWAFIPIILQTYISIHPNNINIPLISFMIIGVGSLGCILAGYLSQKFNTKVIAFSALFSSSVCCLLSPWMFKLNSPMLFILFLGFWGMVVIADSPLFSTLVAHHAPKHLKGTALTIVNCIGFAITIISIQLIDFIRASSDSNLVFMILAIGPVLGLMASRQRKIIKRQTLNN